MTVNTVEEILCTFLEKEVAENILLKKIGHDGKITYVNPTVYKGYIVAESSENVNDDAYPFVIVRVIKVYNGTKETNRRRVYAVVKILFGIYCDGLDEDAEADLTTQNDGSGHTDLWNIMEKTKHELFRNMVIGNKVSVEYEDFSMNIIEEQPLPYWNGYILLTVSMPETEPTVPFASVFQSKFFE